MNASAIAATCYRGTMKAIYGAIAARCCNDRSIDMASERV